MFPTTNEKTLLNIEVAPWDLILEMLCEWRGEKIVLIPYEL